MIDKTKIDNARSIDLIDFLERYKGFHFRHSNGEYRCTEHTSLAVKSDRLSWYWHSKGIGGYGAIDFLMKIDGFDFKGALAMLADGQTNAPLSPPTAATQRDFILPEKANSNRRAYAYLTLTRGLDSKIIQELIQEKKIYEDTKGNAVFVGYDKQGKPRYATLRGTYTDKPFTDDTLLSSMENANKAELDAERKGIGTPATRAGILEKLIKSGLAERKGDKKVKFFTATHKGTALITVLPEQVQSPLMTAEWEEKLKLVERGELSADGFLFEIVGMTTALVKTYEMIKGADALFPSDRENVGKCPRCGGTVTENKKGFCCSDKSCGCAIWKENRFFTAKKKNVTKAIVGELLKSGKVALTGCYSEKTGKTYDCVAILDDTGGQFVNFTMEFVAKKK